MACKLLSPFLMRWTRPVILLTAALAGCSEASKLPGGAGVVEATVLDLPSLISGRVVEQLVTEGQTVAAGDLLARLDCRRLEAEKARIEAELRAAEAEIAVLAARAEAAVERTAAGRLRVEAQRSKQSALDTDLSVARRDAVRLGKMGEYVPPADLDRTESRARRLERHVAAARRESGAARRDLDAARRDAEALAQQRVAAEHRRDAMKARLAGLDIDIGECEVRAPRPGIVEELFYEVGEHAPAGRPLVRVIDLDKVWVTFYLANDQLGAIASQDEAELRADAWPGETFTGRVTTIAAKAEFTPRNIQTRDDRTRLVYPVDVRVDNEGHRLRPGMPVEVTLVGAAPVTAIRVRGLGRSFGGRVALEGVDLDVAEGDLHGLIGPNGAGKTTTLRCVCGLVGRDAGEVSVGDADPEVAPGRVRETIGLMPQEHCLYGDLSIGENLDFFGRLFGLPRPIFRERVERLMDITRLGPFWDRRASKLSGGMYKKLALSCALLHRPPTLLLDEPTNGVDPVSRRELWDLLYELRAAGTTILVATAYLDEAERCHHTTLLSEGRVVATGEPVALTAAVSAQSFEDAFLAYTAEGRETS